MRILSLLLILCVSKAYSADFGIKKTLHDIYCNVVTYTDDATNHVSTACSNLSGKDNLIAKAVNTVFSKTCTSVTGIAGRVTKKLTKPCKKGSSETASPPTTKSAPGTETLDLTTRSTSNPVPTTQSTTTPTPITRITTTKILTTQSTTAKIPTTQSTTTPTPTTQSTSTTMIPTTQSTKTMIPTTQSTTTPVPTTQSITTTMIPTTQSTTTPVPTTQITTTTVAPTSKNTPTKPVTTEEPYIPCTEKQRQGCVDYCQDTFDYRINFGEDCRGSVGTDARKCRCKRITSCEKYTNETCTQQCKNRPICRYPEKDLPCVCIFGTTQKPLYRLPDSKYVRRAEVLPIP